MILRQRTFHAINQLGETSPISFDFLPLFCNFFRQIYFWGLFVKKFCRKIYFLGGADIKLCPISPWRNKLVRLGHIYLATQLYITAHLEDILLLDIRLEILPEGMLRGRV